MIENVSKFEKDLQENEELRKRYDSELRRIAEAKEAQSDSEAIAKAAAALGYDITIADVEKIMAGNEELDQEELEAVSGGLSTRPEDECVADWACYAVLKHDLDDDNSEEACFRQYKCMFVYHDGMFSCKHAGYEGY